MFLELKQDDDSALMHIDNALVFVSWPRGRRRARSEPNSAACGSILDALWIPLRSVAPRGTWRAPRVAS